MADSDQSASVFLYHEPCPSCGSKDNLGRFSDGHGYCFGCDYYAPPDGQLPQRHQLAQKEYKMASDLIDGGVVKALLKRKISEETCTRFGYSIASLNGKTVQIAPYYDDAGMLVAQHIRFPDKDFIWAGDAKEAQMFGQQLCRDGGKMLVVTEGEIDCMSVSQLQGNKWPVVSIACGAAKAEHTNKITRYINRHVEFLENFEKVIFLFDMDEQGRASAQAAAACLSPGKAFIGTLPLKDANEMLLAGRGREVIDAIWGAKEYRPDGLVAIEDIFDEIDEKEEWGLPWVFPTLTRLTYGRRWGELYALGAGTGIGKTDVFTQQIAFDVTELAASVGVIMLEQKPKETGKRVAGKIAGQRFHVPDAGWTREERRAALERLRGKMVLYDNFGETEWDIVKSKIRYMAKAQGIRLIYLDHLTAMADTANEKESIEQIMKEMAGLANELGIIIHFISHLATPEGKPHEEGGRVMIRHFKGSRSIGFWSFFMFGLERDQQSDDPKVRQTTVFRILKDRYTGQSAGEIFHLRYDLETGRLYECDPGEQELPFFQKPSDQAAATTDRPDF